MKEKDLGFIVYLRKKHIFSANSEKRIEAYIADR